jgi:hypothetical protein
MGSTGVTLPPLGLKQLGEAYASGSLTPTQLVQALHPRLASTKAVFIHLASLDDLLARAAALEAAPAAGRGPLWGVPFATKDNVDVAGMPTTAGCPAFSYVPEKSAAAVQALEDAGRGGNGLDSNLVQLVCLGVVLGADGGEGGGAGCCTYGGSDPPRGEGCRPVGWSTQ